MRNKFIKESSLYNPIKKWLRGFLQQKYKNSDVEVFVLDRSVLCKFLQTIEIQDYFPLYQTFEIRIDILGVIKYRKKHEMVFVEVKSNEITLKDIGQIWGYSQVGKPKFSIIISPKGISDSLSLLFSHNRYDITKYDEGKIYICKWNLDRKEVDFSKTYPPGEIHLL